MKAGRLTTVGRFFFGIFVLLQSMNKPLLYSFLACLTVVLLLQTAFQWNRHPLSGSLVAKDVSPDSLRKMYEKPIGEWPKPWIESGVAWIELEALPEAPDPSSAAYTLNPIEQLGKVLFFDPILSGSNTISCSSCHLPQYAFGDNIALSPGHEGKVGNRNTPALLNVKERKSLFWDGREETLESQVLAPISAHHEMNMPLNKLIPKLKAIPAYNDLFFAAYRETNYSMPEVMEALAAFQRTLVSRPSRFDDFLRGNKNALSTKEIHGLHLFRTQARCMNCHYGPYFTDELFHHIGVPEVGTEVDSGRFAVTGHLNDFGSFRTPSLRDVMITGPWMHNGSFSNMIQVLTMYNIGTMGNRASVLAGEKGLHAVLDPLMKPLNLSRNEIAAIESFLHSITASPYKVQPPEKLPR